ncbi:hypothetical protein I4U23_013116 [Adineta vaga]|nr:hypothetical protein I4U23_013116 [Adineta vaga]
MNKHAASEESNEQHLKKLKYTTNEEKDEEESFDQDCPLSFASDGHIILESFSSNYKRAQELLFAVAEPVDDSDHTNTYRITSNSFDTAMFFGLKGETILEDLQELSRTNVPSAVIDLIKSCTESYGKVRLELKQNRYIFECLSPDVWNTLIRDSQIQDCRLISTDNLIDRILTEDTESMSFEVKQIKVGLLRKRCQQLKYPLVENYDFVHDTLLPNLNIELSENAKLRPYQEESLRKVFNNGRARSGIIVLPCGAGKSLVGVAAACTINKRCLVLCNSTISVEQWREQFKTWSTITDSMIRLFTSKKKNVSNDACIYISTYQMIASTTTHTVDTNQAMKLLKNSDWGLILLDEVHMCPADSFRKILTTVRAHIKLGLTATPVREDGRISDLKFLIGPSLYKANWMELQNAGFIAKVSCAEIHCQMTPEFLSEYRRTSENALKRQLSVFNPNKFRTCQFLIEFHEKRNDKIIVFCDDVFALRIYAHKLMKPFVHGEVSHNERMCLLQNFQRNPKINTIFISRVGDTAIDLPEANVVIQLSSHGCSQRQEAQRLGRILRSKKNCDAKDNNAFFYSLASEETDEIDCLSDRQRFLKEQGYSYETLSYTDIVPNTAKLHLSTDEQQNQLLAEVLTIPDQINNRPVNTKPRGNKNSQSAKPIHPLFRMFRK